MYADAPTTLRPRRPSDLPALAELLLAQQPTSRYPFRDPLPIPVEEFLHADDAGAAWTAELDGRLAGHVCWTGRTAGTSQPNELERAAAAAHDCAVDDLAWVSALFTSIEARGRGVGRRLLATVVDDIRRAGRRPCLEVLPNHPAALSLYAATGWLEISRLRPGWLRQAAGEEGPDVIVMTLPASAG